MQRRGKSGWKTMNPPGNTVQRTPSPQVSCMGADFQAMRCHVTLSSQCLNKHAKGVENFFSCHSDRGTRKTGNTSNCSWTLHMLYCSVPCLASSHVTSYNLHFKQKLLFGYGYGNKVYFWKILKIILNFISILLLFKN